jgi:hypothetical protein
MSNTYFERLHREEARHLEWRMLDEALEERIADNPGLLRTALGHLMIRAGARRAGEHMLAGRESKNRYRPLN